MLKLHENQINLWETIFSQQGRDLPRDLAKADTLLDDPRFIQPFIEKFTTRTGRPTLAVETYLRLMYLKRRSHLSYETLIREAGDRISWRRFCRIAMDQKMPSPSTLSKAHRRYGDELMACLEELVEKAGREE